MNRIWTYLLDARVLGVLGLAALVAFLFLGASTLKLAAFYAVAALILVLLIWFTVWVVKKIRARRAARNLEAALEEDASKVQKSAGKLNKAEANVLRGRLLEAVKTIKTSKLGETTGAAALYELPWYMVIGNPAAGKSTAIVKSGLKFPFADSNGSNGSSQIIQGIGGTRNCDWFFTSEGILLDTAGRYSVHEEDRGEWLDFLSLLKKHRSKAPINGILIAASLAELSQAKPEAAIQLAKNLRQRVQELTEKLEVFAPVYLIFTKADLIAGFAEFFEDSDRAERDKVWGATLRYDPEAKTDAVALFDEHFDELHNGLKELAVARMSLHRGQALPPGVLTFPLEFAALKPALRSFVTTLFEENPYQFRPVFRGFYFTSAVQEGTASNRASDRVAQRFALTPRAEHTTAMVVAENGLFLKDLFSRVIFGDRNLVKQFASRQKVRARAITFGAAVVVLALALGGWSWSYLGNRQLVSNVRADLDKAMKLQQDRVDLASRLEAMELLQDRIEQLQAYRHSRPMAISLGLYQGEEIERKLRTEYFNGVRQIMLVPVGQSIEDFLGELNANASKLQPMTKPPESGAASTTNRPAQGSRFSEASAESVEDGYNALKTYLMLADRQRSEPGHLTDQITRFWRGWLESNRGAMPRDQMIRSAERMISFSLANLQDPAFPSVPNNLALVDQTRENLSKVVRGMPARERVYAEVKARAATRFAPVTVARIVGDAGKDSVAGSYAVSGAFTKEAWTEFVEPAFKKAATTELQTVDWVLKTSARDDLSLEGSPEQIRKALTDLYKTEYVREWQRFMQGISIADFNNFEGAVAHMNRLGDATNSPIKKLMATLFDETSWDNPSLLNQRLEQAQGGFVAWFKQTIMRQAPSSVELKVDVTTGKAEIPMGPIGKEFAALSRIMMARENTPALLNNYLQTLGAVRSKFNQVKVQGDPGPASRKMMASTLEGTNSELSEALKFVDEQMLLGMTDTARSALRPLLVRPLIQSFSVIIAPTETEVNRLWAAQVNEPFQRTLAGKYPFDASSKIEATPQEIAKVFGPAGAIAKFSDEALGTLVVRRGDTMTPRTWADMGVRVRPEFAAGFASWVAPLEGAAGAAGASAAGNAGGAAGGAAAIDASQTAFQILPQGSPGLMEYTIEIDGQVLRYRNTQPSWTNFVWPNAAGAPGVRIVGITNAGRSVEIFNEPGRFGLTRMFEVAQRKKLAGGINELSWTQNGQTVTLQLRVISQPGSPTAPATTANGSQGSAPAPVTGTSFKGLKLPALVVGADAPAQVADATAAPSSIVKSTAAVSASGASR
jgi:type VI secretion system protein ImpL